MRRSVVCGLRWGLVGALVACGPPPETEPDDDEIAVDNIFDEETDADTDVEPDEDPPGDTDPAPLDPEDADAIFVHGSSGDDGSSGAWGSPVKSLEVGIDRAIAEGHAEVWVAQGVYAVTLSLRDDLVIRGGFASSDWRRDVDAHGTVLVSADDSLRVSARVTLEGLTVRAFAEGEAPTGFERSAVRVEDGADLTLDQVTVIGGASGGRATAVLVRDDSDVRIRGCALYPSRAATADNLIGIFGIPTHRGEITVEDSLIAFDTPLDPGASNAWPRWIDVRSADTTLRVSGSRLEAGVGEPLDVPDFTGLWIHGNVKGVAIHRSTLWADLVGQGDLLSVSPAAEVEVENAVGYLRTGGSGRFAGVLGSLDLRQSTLWIDSLGGAASSVFGVQYQQGASGRVVNTILGVDKSAGQAFPVLAPSGVEVSHSVYWSRANNDATVDNAGQDGQGGNVRLVGEEGLALFGFDDPPSSFALTAASPASVVSGGLDLSGEGVVDDRVGAPRSTPYSVGAYAAP